MRELYCVEFEKPVNEADKYATTDVSVRAQVDTVSIHPFFP